MRKTKFYFILIFAVLVNLVLFQNCSDNRFGSSSADGSTTKGSTADSTGQPYDGKMYIIASSVCADGTFVEARIVVNSPTSATVVRENCMDTQRELTSAEFSFDSKKQVVYNNLTFTKEVPYVVIPVLSVWYYQLQGTLQNRNALVYDIDLFDTSSSQIQSLKQAGHIVICSLSSGTYENWRPDATSFRAADLGNNVGGSSGERWIDTRSSFVRSIMLSRLDLATSKGCDGVDLDTADGYSNNSGFPLTSATQVDYNQFMAFAAHDRHLIAALKNTPDLVSKLVDAYDFAIAGECFRYNECDKYLPFKTQGKAIFGAEFTAYSSATCNVARNSGISLSYFNQALDGTVYQPCN